MTDTAFMDGVTHHLLALEAISTVLEDVQDVIRGR